ncbi:PKD domain-containing protein [Oopsacas minuta]|uniref:PKD domain-containing protein n=1 Tax=Oopsacas minuta TaxID=111878 RepID=A0AAV7JRN8_9METZ|nr:PKD domain-containing protein [Oopsacas minuta]
MAAGSIVKPPVEDSYELQLTKIREKIKRQFLEIINCLKAREAELLRELDKFLATYHSYKSQVEILDAKKLSIERSNELHELDILTIPLRPIQKLVSPPLITDYPDEPPTIHLVCDNRSLIAECDKLGHLVDRVESSVDYKSKTQPIVSVCDRGEGVDQLNGPYGLAIDDKTGNIYIADQWNNCVKVFDSSANCLSKIKEVQGDGVMNYPTSIAICGDRILISQSNNCILNYELDGTFKSKIGKYIKGGLDSIEPLGLTFDKSNEDIYVCDNSNNRILVVTKYLVFKSQFGGDDLKQPLDIKLSADYIYVLDESNPCIHLFDFDYTLKKKVISRGTGKQVTNPCNFFIDNSNYILVSDCDCNCIAIFNPKFELIHKIQVSGSPMGVTLDDKDRVIVVCQVDKENNRKIALERRRSVLKEELTSSLIDSIGGFPHSVGSKNRNSQSLADPKKFQFVCDDKKLFAEVNNLGRLVEVMTSKINYKSKIQPVVSLCEKGNRTNELNDARGVIVDVRTGNIYVADQLNNCVKVFDSSGNYLFKFGGNHCTLCYKLDGEFISKIGKSGKGEVEFNNPLALTINRENQEIYICDYYNNLIQVLSSEFKFKSQFGKYTLKFPHDIKISEKYVYILDESNPCRHLFDSNLILQRNAISRGKGNQIPNSYYF